MTNAHLEGYKSPANIRTSKGVKYEEIISKLFPGGPDRAVSKPHLVASG